MRRASWQRQEQNLLILDRPAAILGLAPLLESLAERCGQPGAMHWLSYFLDPAVMGRRVPYLVLLLRPELGKDKTLSAADVKAAALFFEYSIFGMRTGAVAHARSTTGDAIGFSSIVAPRGQRTRVAAIAARALAKRGAHLVLATYEETESTGNLASLPLWPGMLSAVRQRRIGRTLRLLPTLEATLAQMGKSTRFNLRYYRRRLEKTMRCEYVPDAVQALQGEDLQALNTSSLNPVDAAEFERRVRSASDLPGSFLSGLRDANGRWLSLMGGWRQGSTTTLFWQMNISGLERHSISTVMRSFFLEHEIARGAQRLLIYGGTPHTMHHAFEKESVADLIVRRKSLKGQLLFWALRFARHGERLGLKSNFLASTLQDPALVWVSGAPPSERPRVALKPALTPAAKLASKPVLKPGALSRVA